MSTGTGLVSNFTIGSTLKLMDGNVIITSNSLSQASVDNILAVLAALDGTGGTTLFGAGKTVTLTGGAFTPSAGGLVNVGILQGRGVTVNHN